MKQKKVKPLLKVVLVGRPNVGKSSLFNALLERRRSIIDPARGVTRDPVVELYDKGAVDFSLVDTGGFTLAKDEISTLVRAKTLAMVKEAGLIIFVVDVMEWTGEDKEFLDYLRPYADKLILAVNKVDNDSRMIRYYDFLSLGLPQTCPISVTHTRGLKDFRLLLEKQVAQRSQEEAGNDKANYANMAQEGDLRIRVAIVGRPNAGKSTLINYLSGEELAIVSPIAGTTRDVLKSEFKHGNTYYEVWDTAGIRRKSRVGNSVEYYSVHRALQSLYYADVVYLLVDAQRDLVEQDKKIAYQAIKRGKGLVICLSKWDLLEKRKNLLEAMVDRVRFLFPRLDFVPVVPISSFNGQGFEDLLRVTHRIYKELGMRLETARLNEALKTWLADCQPPRPFKIKFLTQVSEKPVRFLLFVNRTEGFPQAYMGYIHKKLRSLGMAHISFEVELKTSS